MLYIYRIIQLRHLPSLLPVRYLPHPPSDFVSTAVSSTGHRSNTGKCSNIERTAISAVLSLRSGTHHDRTVSVPVPHRSPNSPSLCGFPLPKCSLNSSSAVVQHQRSRQKRTSPARSVAMGLLFSLFCIFGLLMIVMESRRRQKKRRVRKENSNSVGGGGDSGGRDRYYMGSGNSGWKLTSAREAMSINLATFENPLRNLTFADLLEATNGFHDDSLIGSGGFGDVYKALLKDGSVVAIKKLIHVSGQGHREFTAEIWKPSLG
ncbi:hypothetical protein ZOSMA_251G00380 [Zostera marina]|uniref:non-specific serine/threonine protein kinase n=1 Tax=Zostera marina TaxID=29655 RepID=A0A0K9PG59_ZOSMR|nr:hypothetical protein ZOSMA_251G00380 [Zostera marina]